MRAGATLLCLVRQCRLRKLLSFAEIHDEFRRPSPPGAKSTLTHIYGLDIAIRAFNLVQKEMPGAEFWILGSGPEKSALEALSQELGMASSVKFIGAVLPEEVHHWLRRCDIGVLATRQDVFLDYSFSNKLSEYIIMDKAVIASRLKAIRHYFSEGALAFFEPENLCDIAQRMVTLYNDKDVRLRLSERAKTEFQPLRWEVMKDRYLNLVHGLMSCVSEEVDGQF